MTELKYGSKKAVALAQNYWNSYYDSLTQCYIKPSQAKLNAQHCCKLRMLKWNGYDFRICTFNSHMFTAGYRFKENGTEYLAYETPTYTYKIRLS